MGKKQQMMKLFVVLFLGTAFIFCSSHFGVKAFEHLTDGGGKYSEGTAIGALDVSGKTESEVMSLLEKKYVEWLKSATIQLQYGEKSAPFDMSQFHLNAKQTVNSLKDGQKNRAYITIDQSQVDEQIQILFPQINSKEINIVQLTNSLNESASQFEKGSKTFNLVNDYLLASNKKKDAELTTVIVNLNDVPLELQAIIEKNPVIDIPAESTFSLLEFAKKQKITQSDTLNVLATSIYQAILPTNFEIEERNIGSSLPDYTSLGYEAKVNQSKQIDFIFANPNKSIYHLELQLVNHQLKVILKGEKFLYDYKIVIKDEQTLKPKTIIQYSPLLQLGKTKVMTTGADGKIAKVYREVFQGSQLLKSELIVEDYYPPVYQVEVHGLERSSQSTGQTGGDQPGTAPENQSTANEGQTAPGSDAGQTDSTDSDIWGKQNEQPK